MTTFQPTPRQAEILRRLAAPGAFLLHVRGRSSRGSGIYILDGALGAPSYQGRTVRPLIDAGQIRPGQIKEDRP